MGTCVWLLILSLTLQLSTCDVHIYVSPRGSDSNDGHSDKVPVKTVFKAIALSAQSKFNNQTVYIELMQGDYYLDRTVYMTRKNTVLRSYGHEEVHIIGGNRIPSSSVKPVTDQRILARLPSKARSHVRVVNLTSLHITDFGKMDEYGSGRRRESPLEVFYNGNALHLARWPNNDYLDIVGVPDGRYGARFQYNSTVPSSWHNESDPWVYGFWYYSWADKAEKVKSLDASTNMVTLFHKTPRGLRNGHLHQYRKSQSNAEGGYFYFMNILSALDEPGEFYMDRQSGNLYMWLPNRDGNMKSTDILQLSKINDCIRVRAPNIRLEDFTLEVCKRSGIYAANVKQVKVYNLEIRNTGGSAANFVGDCRDTEISRCYIHDTCGGISLYGGKRKTLESSGNSISNNEIVRFSRVGVVNQRAVQVRGVGITVAYNHIYNSGSSGIYFWGNDIVMEHNLIHHICAERSSCSAIVSSADWTLRGNKIIYNIIHHVNNLTPGGRNIAVLLDGQLSGTSVMYNVLYDNSVHVAIHGGRYNTVVNNVMYNAQARSVEVDNRGISHRSDTNLLKALHNMPYKNATWSLRYPHLANIDHENASLPEASSIEPGQTARWCRLACLYTSGKGNQVVRNIIHAAPHTEYIHGISSLLRPHLANYFNFSQTGLSTGSTDHYRVENGDFRLRCRAADWANRVNFKQPPSPNAVGPTTSPVGPTYLHRGRVHLVNTTYPSMPCTYHAPRSDTPRYPYLPDGSHHNDLYPVENVGCWLNVTKCRSHPASIGTYRDMYGERYHHAADSEELCFKRALEQWKFCGSRKDELVAVIYGPTGATTLGGSGCVAASYGCPKHGGPAKGHDGKPTGVYFHDRSGEHTHTEEGCLAHVDNYWRYCGSNESFPVTNIYLSTGATRTAGGGCWITMDNCPAHTSTGKFFYDAFGSTNYQTDTSEFACLHQAEYYWHYCGSDTKFPVTATFRRTTATKTYP